MKAPAEPFADLGLLLSALVAAPVQAQRILDQQWERDAAFWEGYAGHFVSQAPAAWRGELAGLLNQTTPARQVVGTTELDCHLRLRVERAHGWSIRAQALEIGWEVLYGTRRQQALHVSLTVEPVPLPAAPSATTGLPVAADENPLQCGWTGDRGPGTTDQGPLISDR